jgi:hypothetical protein
MKKSITIFWMVVASVSIGSGQSPDQEKPGVFVNDNGRIFINKHLPVYLWLSTSPEENARAYRLTSDSSETYSNPMYFDTEGRNTVRSPWCVDTVTKQMVYPLAHIIFDVYADGRSPVTRARISGKVRTTRDGITCYGERVEIILTATDAVSGVSSTYYSLNNKSFEKYTKPFFIEEEGDHTLSWFSVDKVGNRENQQEKRFTVIKKAD